MPLRRSAGLLDLANISPSHGGYAPLSATSFDHSLLKDGRRAPSNSVFSDPKWPGQMTYTTFHRSETCFVGHDASVAIYRRAAAETVGTFMLMFVACGAAIGVIYPRRRTGLKSTRLGKTA